ncbi:MAG TPA: phenylalanine--tRNA ligase subunit beta, partial [Clostridiales bacterium]|nr:phenylalanine--tRNA ligase subunit beta [Clostridiales bacterium]
MKVSLNWIREYIDLPENLTIEKLSYDLTMRTVEVEGCKNLGDAFQNIVAGRILSVSAHPKADRLRVVMADIGESEPVQVVCGGSNLEPGQMVAVAKPGAKVIWHGEGEPVEIKITKLRGVESYGMICGANEIGLENLLPAADDHEIIDLKGIGCQPGDNIAAVLFLEDQILEIDNKSMTNRPDLWGHYGIARELAAIYNLELKALPAFPGGRPLPEFPVQIENSDLCRRYTAIVYSGLKNEPSPLWLRSSLYKVGLRPINNIVDITNYIMLAVGQPAHGFDKSHVRDEIRVRTARKNELLELLDGKELRLGGKNLVIADRSEVLALAGIMGGKKDSVLPETTEIILELANFSPTCIRHTTQEFGLRTEASIRFEKHVDTQRIDLALGLATRLFREILPNSVMTAFSDVCPQPTEPAVIDVTIPFLSVRLGSPVTAADVERSLAPLGFTTSAAGDHLKITVPSWRSTGDVSLADDILEEVARMIGYANFALIPPAVVLDKPVNQLPVQLERKLREYLACRCGFQEVFTYPWTEEKFILAAGINPDSLLTLSTPPAPENRYLRASLVPGLLEAIVTNLKHVDTFRIFELTQVFSPGAVSPSSADEALPLQQRFLTGVLTGSDAEKLFFEAKGILENMARYSQMQDFAFAREQEPAWTEKKVWLNLIAQGEIIGSVGLLSLKA